MTQIIWEFEVPENHSAQFEQHYGPTGEWVELFQRDPAFRGTLLLHDREKPGRYLTIDHWEDLESYEAFRAQYATEYQSIDRRTEGLAASEKRLGVFDQL